MTEERASWLEGAFEQVDRRLDDMNQYLSSLRSEMNSLRADMNSRTNNLYVLLLGYWVTIIAAIIGLYFRS